MISVRSFLRMNQELCDKNHNCNICPLYKDGISCVFRCKSVDDIPQVIDSICVVEELISKGIIEAMENSSPQFMPVKKDPEEAITKALKEIKNELHDMKRIMDKRRS